MGPIVSTRTPEGEPVRCPICGAGVRVEPSTPAGDSPCPNCGHLLWFVPGREGVHLFPASSIGPDVRRRVTSFLERWERADRLDRRVRADSLDVIEIVMEMEEELGVHLTDEEARGILNLDDFVNVYLRKVS